MAWTVEQVMALAPDASSASSGKGLGSSRKWVSLGSDDVSVWGECQGSGKLPYQASIDLSEPAFKCTCPSRKFPCKHSLGLFLIYVSEPKAMTQKSQPAWVVDWLKTRTERQEKKEKKKEVEAIKAADPAEQVKRAAQAAKRAETRSANVSDGIADLERFLRDVMRGGLASLPAKPYTFWEGPAARMVDAQAPGLARLLRAVGTAVNSGDGWQERVLERLGRLFLLLEAFKCQEKLSPDLQAEIRSILGFTINQDEVLTQTGIHDAWHVVAQRIYDEDRLRVKRSWLWGAGSQRLALVLQFAHAGQPLDASILPGTILKAELCFYPGASPLRAVIKHRDSAVRILEQMPGCGSLDEALERHAASLQAAPWTEVFPFVLREGRPFLRKGRWWLSDSSGRALPMSGARDAGWRLLSLSGGGLLGWAGEWNGEELLPLGATYEGRYVVC